jgi:hypothetical protein
MSKLNSVVLYWATRETHQDHRRVAAEGERIGFIRAEIHRGKDISEALDAAKPGEAETVLNSVPLK